MTIISYLSETFLGFSLVLMQFSRPYSLTNKVVSLHVYKDFLNTFIFVCIWFGCMSACVFVNVIIMC